MGPHPLHDAQRAQTIGACTHELQQQCHTDQAHHAGHPPTEHRLPDTSDPAHPGTT